MTSISNKLYDWESNAKAAAAAAAIIAAEGAPMTRTAQHNTDIKNYHNNTSLFVFAFVVNKNQKNRNRSI